MTTATKKKSNSGQSEKATKPKAPSAKTEAPPTIGAVKATSKTVKAKVAPTKTATPKAKHMNSASAALAPSIVQPKALGRRVVPKALGTETARVRNALGVSREFFARMTGFSLRSIASWEGGTVVSALGLRRIKEMNRLRISLAEVMQEDFIPKWLDNPCEMLGGLKPVEVLERGETDRLWRTVLLLGSGMPT